VTLWIKKWFFICIFNSVQYRYRCFLACQNLHVNKTTRLPYVLFSLLKNTLHGFYTKRFPFSVFFVCHQLCWRKSIYIQHQSASCPKSIFSLTLFLLHVPCVCILLLNMCESCSEICTQFGVRAVSQDLLSSGIDVMSIIDYLISVKNTTIWNSSLWNICCKKAVLYFSFSIGKH